MHVCLLVKMNNTRLIKSNLQLVESFLFQPNTNVSTLYFLSLQTVKLCQILLPEIILRDHRMFRCRGKRCNSPERYRGIVQDTHYFIQINVLVLINLCKLFFSLPKQLNFARFYFPRLFPEITGRLVVVDSDAIVQGDIEELSEIPMRTGDAVAFSDDCTAVSNRVGLHQVRKHFIHCLAQSMNGEKVGIGESHSREIVLLEGNL